METQRQQSGEEEEGEGKGRGDLVPRPPQGLPAEEIASKLDASWICLSQLTEPWIERSGSLVEAIARKMDFTAAATTTTSRVPSAIPMILLLVVLGYFFHVVIAICVFRTLLAFLAWEEAFVVEAMFVAWLASASRLRTYVATEINRAISNKLYSQQTLYVATAYAQSKPVVALVFVAAPIRLFVRCLVFPIPVLLIVESICDTILIFVIVAIIVYSFMAVGNINHGIV